MLPHRAALEDVFDLDILSMPLHWEQHATLRVVACVCTSEGEHSGKARHTRLQRTTCTSHALQHTLYTRITAPRLPFTPDVTLDQLQERGIKTLAGQHFGV
jgi:hypothetical protein